MLTNNATIKHKNSDVSLEVHKLLPMIYSTLLTQNWFLYIYLFYNICLDSSVLFGFVRCRSYF